MMKKTARFALFCISLLISFAAVLSTTVFLGAVEAGAEAADLFVCPTCTYTTIQDAVAAANNDDIIHVAEGTYTGMMSSSGITATVMLTKSLTLEGGYNSDFSQRDPSAYVTTIDTQSNSWGGVCILGSQSVVDGFHIVNAYGGGAAVADNQTVDAVGTLSNNHIANNRIVSGTQMSDGGAGINIANGAEAVISDNEIVGNMIERPSTYGGGIRVTDAAAEIFGNTIAHNQTYSDTVGGGIDAFRSTVVISGNNVHHNENVGIGIYQSTAEVISNTVDSNITKFGGGGFDIGGGSTFTLTGNIISNNLAELYSGGGIIVNDESTGVIKHNQLTGNHTEGEGGGIGTYRNGDLTIANNSFMNNSTPNGGGGMHINPDDYVANTETNLTVSGNVIHNNEAFRGAGLDLGNVKGEVLISANDIRSNQIAPGAPDYESGGIQLWEIEGKIRAVNNLFVQNDNRGLKASNFKELEIVNNTFVNHNGDALDLFAWPDVPPDPFTANVVNNIIVGSSGCGAAGWNGVDLYVDYNLFFNNDTDICDDTAAPPLGNLYAAPQFVDPAAGNYQLQGGSPAIDSGSFGPHIPNVDIDGISRPQGSGIDMGAYEAFRYQQFLPIAMRKTLPASENYSINNRQEGIGFSGDSHAWLSANDGWGFAPQPPPEIHFFRWDGSTWNLHQTLPNGGSGYFYGTDIKMLSANDGWAVATRTGDGGPSTFFHWDGSSWSEVQSGIGATIISMDFLNSDEGWAAGLVSCCGAKFFHWDGVSWKDGDYLQLDWPDSDIALLSNGDGWAVGTTIARKSGNHWAVYGSPVAENLSAISMVSANDGWIVGNAGTILHWNGSNWTAVPSPTTENLRDLEMVQADHGWAVGENGTILRWNGTEWSLVTSPVNANFYEVDLTGINEGWIPYHADGYGLLQITTP